MTEKPPPPLPTLPMHLMLAMGCWLNSPSAWRCAKSALPSLNASASPLPKAEARKLERALAEEAKNRASNLLTGVLTYYDTPYSRTMPQAPCIWQNGNARLLDYGFNARNIAPDAPVALFVPSLINKYYILDLEEERSMLRYLRTQDIYPLVLDWGDPGEREQGFDCSDYVMRILIPAIEFIVSATRRPIALTGYCMGGIFALAAAQHKPKLVNALGLFATPWDFHCASFKPFILDTAWHDMLESAVATRGMLPADMIQSLFYMTDPWVFEQKFRRFASLPAGSRAAKDFIALEHWVNDGVAMTSGVARDSLIGWAQQNKLARGQWQAGGTTVKAQLPRSLPVFIALPQNDHVVPLDCAQPLAEKLRHAHIERPGAGHVGMIVGRGAKRELWQPLAEWLHAARR